MHALLESATGADPERARQASTALFRILAEGLADRFEPRFCDAYAAIFSEVIAALNPEWSASDLLSRYRRVRRQRRYEGKPDRLKRVFVLSRVTLGADIAVTSVILDAAKRRFPKAEICLVGGTKSYELFAADPRIHHVPVSYGRADALRERLAVWKPLSEALAAPDSLVIDPDSRLTQLGLLPVCPDENYWFFESRSFGAESGDPLAVLTARWLEQTFDVNAATPYIAPACEPDISDDSVIAVSLGVGENPAKRVPDPFEERLLARLSEKGSVVLVDKGAGDDEAARVDRAAARSGAPSGQVRTWQGSFAAFASIISRSRLYVGYDSAGQHAAAASGAPLVSIFGGFASERMFARWRPTGPGPIEVVRVDQPDPDEILRRTLVSVDRLLAGA